MQYSLREQRSLMLSLGLDPCTLCTEIAPNFLNLLIILCTLKGEMQRLQSCLTLSWFKSFLSDCFQFVHVNDESPVNSKISQGVPQGSVPGPLLFTLYMLPLSNIFRNHSVNFHCFVDGSQSFINKTRWNKSAKLKHVLKTLSPGWPLSSTIEHRWSYCTWP